MRMKYIRENWHPLTIAALTGIALGLMVHLAITKSIVERTIGINDWKHLLGMWLVMAILLFGVLPKAGHYLKRYRATMRLSRPPLQYLDLIGILLSAFLTTGLGLYGNTLILIFRSQNSLQFLLFLLATLLLAGVWIWLVLSESDSANAGIEPQHFVLPTSGVYFDDAIRSEQEDILQRGQFVEGLYKQMIDLPLRSPFVFSLDGEWGEGKTSVLNLLRLRLRSDEKVLLASFNPWFLSSQTSLISAFYGALERAILRHYTCIGFRRLLHRYRDLLLPGLKLLGIELGTYHDPQEMQNELGRFIGRTERRLVILIDDIDRIPKEEMLAVLKITGLTARFRNTIFLLCFDHLMVTKMLKEEIKVDPAFLEKIIQKTVKLPATERKLIDRFLYISDSPEDGSHRSAIDVLFDKLKIDSAARAEFDDKMNYFYYKSFNKLFKTLRQAKRYMNSLSSSLPSVKDEVNLYDFVLLEAVRINWRALYKDIFTNPWYYIPAWTLEFQVAFPGSMRNESSQADRTAHIRDLVKGEPFADVALEILEEIFFIEVRNAFRNSSINHSGVADKYRKDKRLTHPECFVKYFMYRSATDDIPDLAVETFLDELAKLDDNDAQSHATITLTAYQGKNQFIQFVEKLAVFSDKLPKERVFSLVRALYLSAPRLSRSSIDPWRTEYYRAEQLVIRLIESRAADDQAIRQIVEDVVKNSLLSFAVLVTASLHKADRSGKFRIVSAIDLASLRKIVSSRLREHLVQGQRDIFEDMPHDSTFILFEWGSDWRTLTGENRAEVENYVGRLIEEKPRLLAKLLEWFVLSRPGFEEEHVFNLDGFSKIYNPGVFAERVGRLREHAFVSVEERNICKLFERAYRDSQNQTQ